jgi:hypothetical protein
VSQLTGGIDVLPPDAYAHEIERELLDQFEAHRESMLTRGEG